jgi:hypothetical protein
MLAVIDMNVARDWFLLIALGSLGLVCVAAGVAVAISIIRSAFSDYP